ncbi:site-specific integrase [Curtobacterium sp. MCBD17_035]|uniref:site-specific integrase n=1 Tax=Curtobacterium sp. MCBD17_035 TaxID=2175673 RepID=UPI000DA86AFB|nr:site-specific integrase [Curtobacterium sp. MCBD17_035]WIB68066.1 site-specific integrase [Curtobacterium sp. MCBD17_035]
MADIYRRCGCRRPDGKSYGSLPDRATDAQRAAACPRLLTETGHGSWGFYISAGKDPGTGKRLQLRESTFTTKREAQQARAAKLTELSTGRYRVDRKLTVREYLEQWLRRRVDDGLRASTAYTYSAYVTNDIVPQVGALKLTDLRRHHIDALVRKLRDDGRGGVTVRRIYSTLRAALADAERLDLIASNPAANVTVPTPARKPMTMWEPQQAQQFLDGLTDERLGVLFEFALYTGMRRGEIVGLRWSDVDLPRAQVTVRQQRVQVGSRVEVGAVKTDAGQDRRVLLGANVVGSLIAWQVRQAQEAELLGSTYNPSGYVFTTALGEPLRPDYVTKRFDVLVTRAGLPRMRFHGLRHMHASLMLASGVDLGTVSKRLGHSTLAITSDLYGHLLDETNRRAAEAMDALMMSARGGGARTLHTQPVREDQ